MTLRRKHSRRLSATELLIRRVKQAGRRRREREAASFMTLLALCGLLPSRRETSGLEAQR